MTLNVIKEAHIKTNNLIWEIVVNWIDLWSNFSEPSNILTWPGIFSEKPVRKKNKANSGKKEDCPFVHK